MSKPIMTIIGFGPMGKHFTSLFNDDFDVRVSSSRDIKADVENIGVTVAKDRKKSMSVSDYIFLAVPISALAELIKEVNAYTHDRAMV